MGPQSFLGCPPPAPPSGSTTSPEDLGGRSGGPGGAMGMWQGPWHQGLREAKGGQRRREEEDKPQATGGRGGRGRIQALGGQEDKRPTGQC